MASTVKITASVSLIVHGGDTLTLDELMSFMKQARDMGMDPKDPMKTSITAPYGHDQRDRSPGSFTITATPTEDRS